MKSTLTLRLQPPRVSPEQGSTSEQRLPSPSYPALQTQLPGRRARKISPRNTGTNHREEGQPAWGEWFMARKTDSSPLCGEPGNQGGHRLGPAVTQTQVGIRVPPLSRHVTLGESLNLWETLFPYLENGSNLPTYLIRMWSRLNELIHMDHLAGHLHTFAPYKA